jgi:hypothetical protein
VCFRRSAATKTVESIRSPMANGQPSRTR